MCDRGTLGVVVPLRDTASGDTVSRAGHCHAGQPAVQLHHWSNISQYAVCFQGSSASLLAHKLSLAVVM